MSLIEVTVPQLPESVSEATLMSWHKKAGEYVNRDENLIDLETDKVVLELPAPQAGVLVEIVQNDGATVTSGQLIARIDTAAQAGATAAPVAATAAQPAATTTAAAADTSAQAGHNQVMAMPAAKKLAAETGVELAGLQGSGRDGRVLKEDVVAAANKPAAAPKAAAPAIAAPAVNVATLLGDRPEQRVPMSRLRQRVAERLVQSQQTNAILTTFNEVNMKPVMDLRNKYKDKFEKEHGIKLGFMGFFVKAAVAALKKYPVLNASVDGTDIITTAILMWVWPWAAHVV